MVGWTDPKTIQDTYGNDVPYFRYVEWLEKEVERLKKSNASLRSKISAQHEATSRELRNRYDHVPYADDDYDR